MRLLRLEDAWINILSTSVYFDNVFDFFNHCKQQGPIFNFFFTLTDVLLGVKRIPTAGWLLWMLSEEDIDLLVLLVDCLFGTLLGRVIDLQWLFNCRTIQGIFSVIYFSCWADNWKTWVFLKLKKYFILPRCLSNIIVDHMIFDEVLRQHWSKPRRLTFPLSLTLPHTQQWDKYFPRLPWSCTQKNFNAYSSEDLLRENWTHGHSLKKTILCSTKLHMYFLFALLTPIVCMSTF